ncbi:protein REVEILLE 6-like isoform X1 [Ananas comosus]|uniref:Protein REVEILLE 6-like isoform X1 n=1 Tax=Ananas comosus TaxID=4615 RepID=A0A6P5EM14_ANACO|nr:protein REVEILLE 6-like isoform X1 [Ananas comosus]
MVRVNPPHDGGGASRSSGFYTASPPPQQQQQQQQSGSGGGGSHSGMALHGLVTNSAAAEADAAEDPSKKVRKPYTITKSRENWTEQEHDKFLEALQLFDRDWKKIEAFVGSKTVIQIRSHAQKYFLKVQKNGASAHVPPPRPKRKAAHPYPQKASKNAPIFSQPTTPYQASSSCVVEPGFALGIDSSPMLRNSSTSATVSSWAHNTVQPVGASSMMKEDIGASAVMNNNCCCSSTEGQPRARPVGETTDQVNQVPSLHIMPDFARVYSFLGSVFDPSTSGHLQKLKEMDPIDVETVLLLMRNLSINLISPDFEDHRKLLLSHDLGPEEFKLEGGKHKLQADRPMIAPFLVKSE